MNMFLIPALMLARVGGAGAGQAQEQEQEQEQQQQQQQQRKGLERRSQASQKHSTIIGRSAGKICFPLGAAFLARGAQLRAGAGRQQLRAPRLSRRGRGVRPVRGSPGPRGVLR